MLRSRKRSSRSCIWRRSRLPTANDAAAIRRHLQGRDLTEAVQDTVWAVLNTREFLFQH